MNIFNTRWLLYFIWISSHQSVMQCLEFDKWFSIPELLGYQYTVTNENATYTECKKNCFDKYNGSLAKQLAGFVQNLKTAFEMFDLMKHEIYFAWTEANQTCAQIVVTHTEVFLFPTENCSSPAHCLCEQLFPNTEFEKWFSVLKFQEYQFIVTKANRTYEECKKTCISKYNGSLVVQRSEFLQNLKTVLLATRMHFFAWTEAEETCGMIIAIPTNVWAYRNASCSSPAHCLCEQLITTTESLSGSTLPDFNQSTWILDNLNEYFVSYYKSTLPEARAFCKTLNATLVAFRDVAQYLKLSGRIQLHAAEYWVDDAMPVDNSTCLKLNAAEGSLQSRDCSELAYSICNRFAFQNNISQVLERPEFVEMIREMTVVKNTTSMTVRKLKSAEDKRTVAKVSGTVAISMMAGTFLIIFLSDFSRILRTVFN
ncbi:uncharacterized protein LOC127831113 [Dreissena polymorpha]|uniref:uncharacterized protein LOC127831113 n=1 Tax=Dreissena polymorpha TaxID=45954 RepID=UPI002263E0D4|nr:uncharacterized protein LOC127831113 [Dreissena polymorpha]